MIDRVTTILSVICLVAGAIMIVSGLPINLGVILIGIGVGLTILVVIRYYVGIVPGHRW